MKIYSRGPILLVDDELGESLQRLFEREDILTLTYMRGLKAITDIENGLRYKSPASIVRCQTQTAWK